MSRRLIAYEWMSLDGVLPAPSAADEDRDNGFSHGGWHLRCFDDMSRQWVLDGLQRAGHSWPGPRQKQHPLMPQTRLLPP